MITSIKDFKLMKEQLTTEIAVQVKHIPKVDELVSTENTSEPSEQFKMAYDIAMYAKDFEMSKPDTIGMVQKIFVDPSQAPDDISVAFVQDNLGLIVDILDKIPDSDYPENPMTFTNDMESNSFPFECVMYAPNNDKVKKLAEALHNQIKKKDFKVIYENGIFFINSLEQLNESNRKIVMNILNESSAKNISNQLKWKRKLI